MKSIGGYHGLELNNSSIYHKNALALNTGRNALEYILLAHKYKKIYLPYYSCDVLLEPMKKLKIEYNFYHINEKLEPLFSFDKIKKNEVFLYINYFGIKESYIKNRLPKNISLIIDNSQSFYSQPIKDVDTFYSARKFFGVPDGAYLYTNKKIKKQIIQDISYNRFNHLLKRLDIGVENAYQDFKENEDKLISQPIKLMSNLTQNILQSINYKKVSEIRKENFLFLHKNLYKKNSFKFNIDNNFTPLIYPFLNYKKDLRKKLIQQKIYTATYWPNVLNWVKENQLEYKLANNLIALPIHQQYNLNDMKVIINKIKNII